MARLRDKYLQEIQPKLYKEYKYSSMMQIPRLTKITVNMGVGEATQNPKTLEAAVADLTKISGQKPTVTRARKSISNFKLRQGNAIGCAVTLRRERMFEFLDRLVSIAMPRIRDFRGVNPKSFDGRGNYNLGLKEQLIFPEIDYDKIDKVRGMTISITTTAKTDDEARRLLTELGMPFRKQESNG
ncbi:MAG: 50S ribosomal protein L5 [candidate division Zixibacteria bacterium]|nr:50S ribosomal protein L5 [candidate division Zixibacteria bacterium]